MDVTTIINDHPETFRRLVESLTDCHTAWEQFRAHCLVTDTKPYTAAITQATKKAVHAVEQFDPILATHFKTNHERRLAMRELRKIAYERAGIKDIPEARGGSIARVGGIPRWEMMEEDRGAQR